MDAALNWLRQSNVSFGTVLATVIVLAVAFAAIAVSNRYIWRLLQRFERRLTLSHETSLAITRSTTVVLWIIAVMLILNLWGISMSGLWTLLVSIAAVIGVGFLAFWAMISNVTASLFLTIWRPFHLGQTVELLPENLKGRVIDRNMMFTALREDSGSVLQVPNNLFFQKIFRVSGNGEPSYFEYLEENGRAKSAGAPTKN